MKINSDLLKTVFFIGYFNQETNLIAPVGACQSLIGSKDSQSSACKITNLLILNWNQITLSFSNESTEDKCLVGIYPDSSFAFFIHKNFCHSAWPNQSVALIDSKTKLQDSHYGLLYLKNYGLILNKIHQEQGDFFIKYQETTEECLLLKIDLDEARWFGQLIELQLAGQALAEYL